MATIAGSQFSASASAVTFPGGVNVVITTDGVNGTNGQPLGSDTVAGDFNLEVYNGPAAGAPTSPFAGYQGLSILSGGGYNIDLLGSNYAITDNGSGDSLTVDAGATNDTINGGGAFSNLTLNGNNSVANGGAGGNYIAVNGTGDTVNGGAGPDAVVVNSSGNTVNGGGGANSITLLAGNNTVTGGSGPDTITAIGSGDSITGGSGPDVINAVGSNETIAGGFGSDTVNVFGNTSTVTLDTVAGAGADTVGLYGDNDSASGGSGGGLIVTTGNADTVTAGSGNLNVQIAGGGNFQFNDTTSTYNDTIVGFSSSSGDHIHLVGGHTVATSALQPNHTDTLVTLSNGSTILLVGVTDTTGVFN